MMKKCMFAAALIVCSAISGVARGDIAVYELDFSGTSTLGNELRVFGTLTVDDSLSADIAVQNADLKFQYNNDVPFALTDEFQFSADQAFDFNRIGDDLYIKRINVGVNSRIEYRVFGSDLFAGLQFGSGGNPHSIGYNDLTDADPFESFELLRSFASAGPDGFLVGTAIPEPTGFIALVGSLAALSTKRRRLK